MADVFISYAREDRDKAERLARALSAEGLHVWWDEESLRSGGESFSQSIDRALREAGSVLVLWSPSSIASNWVAAEALRAWEQGKLHSVWLAHDVPVRVPFNASHARNLSDWDGGADFPELRRLIADIRASAASAAVKAPGNGASGQGDLVGGTGAGLGPGGQRRLWPILLALAAPTAVALLAAWVLMQWHRPTRVELDLFVDRLEFMVAPSPPLNAPTQLLGQGQVRAVRAEQVSRVDVTSQTLEMADQTRYDPVSGRFPAGAWHRLPSAGAAALELLPGPAGTGGSVTLEPGDPAAPGSVKGVLAPAGTRVVMESGMEKGGHQPWLTLDLWTGGAQADLVFPDAVLISADSMGLRDASGVTAPADSLSLRARDTRGTLVSILGSERRLVLQVEPAGQFDALLGGVQIRLTSLDLTRQEPTDERLSAIVGPGALSYPDLPSKGKLELAAGDLVRLDRLEWGRIESLSIGSDGGQTGLRLRLDAVASQVRVGPPGHTQDARLTWFEWLWHQPTLATLFAIGLWLFPTTLAGYRLWQGLRSSRDPS